MRTYKIHETHDNAISKNAFLEIDTEKFAVEVVELIKGGASAQYYIMVEGRIEKVNPISFEIDKDNDLCIEIMGV